MKKILLILVFTISTFLQAQTDSLNPPKWNYSGVSGLNINQIALSNWAQGGENSLAWTLTLNLAANYASGNWALTNNLKLAYGRTKLGTTDFKTNDNELYLEDVLSYKIGWALDPFFSNTVRTALSDGYNYKFTPAPKIVTFFDPGYVTQSIGFAYNKSAFVNTRLGIAFQETFTNQFRNFSDPTNFQKAFKFETGVESVTATELPVAKNMQLSSKLRLFSRFESLDVWDVRWDNTLTAKVNDFLNVNLNVLVLYEKSQTIETQLKEGLQLGFVYTLF